MLEYLLLCLLATSQGINARPAHSGPADLSSHILIVTPQAEVHLEPALKYEAVVPNTFIQHLSPLARYAAPHDETIIYVPSGAALNAVARSVEQARRQDAKQYEQISQQIEQVQGAIQQGSAAVGPQLSEAATAAASAASNAGSGLFPALFPPAVVAGSQKDDKLKADKIEYESISTVAATPLLSGAGESRRFYALTPAVSHVIDVYVGPLSAIRARSIQADEIEQATKKLSEITPAADSSKTDPLIDLNDKKEPEAFKETLTIEADRLKEDRNRPEQREQRPESRGDKLEESKSENVKLLKEKHLEDKKLDEKQLEEKSLVEKKLTDNKFEKEKFEEKKLLEKKAEEKLFEEKKYDEKKLVEKKFEEKLLEEKPQPQPQQIAEENKQQLLQQPLQQEAQQSAPLLDKLQTADKVVVNSKLPLQELKEQSLQERKEQPIVALERKEPSIQERKEEAKEIKQPAHEQQEQPQQKQLLVTPQQHKQLIQPEQQEQQKELQPQQQQKQLQQSLEKNIEEKQEQESKEKREDLELNKENQLKLEQEQSLKESFKINSVKTVEPELNKIASEAEKEQQNSAIQVQQQRAANGRVESFEAVPVQQAHHHSEEQQPQKSVVGTPVDQLPSVPLLVPQTKTV